MRTEATNVNATKTGGFISIDQAEQMRQSVTREEFAQKHPQEYERAVVGCVALKKAQQEYEASLSAIAALTTPTRKGDLAGVIERDAQERLRKPTVQAHPTIDTVKAPAGVDSRSRKVQRRASVKDVGGSSRVESTSETVPAPV